MKILYEDENIIVCFKEAGLAVENADISRPDLASTLKKHLKSPYLGIVHRLDMPVEGLLAFGKDQKSAAKLTAMLGDSVLNKNYLALVCGKPSSEKGQLVDYLAVQKVSGRTASKKAIVVKEGSRDSKRAVLDYEVINSRTLEDMEITLLDINIETGRFHQIRAQLSNAGLPILGDKKYGNDLSDKAAALLGIRNVALYANRLSLIHPVTGKKMDFKYIPDIPTVEELLNDRD